MVQPLLNHFRWSDKSLISLNSLLFFCCSTASCLCGSTHHADGEVVVDDAVRHRVAALILVGRGDVDLPAVQHHLGAVLDVPHDLQQALTLVACSPRRRRPRAPLFNNQRNLICSQLRSTKPPAFALLRIVQT